MKRSELELLINDAADGVLDKQEIQQLEQALHAHPDLESEYEAIMHLPDLKGAFPIQKHDIQIHRLKQEILSELEDTLDFDEAGWQWFRKYGAVAAVTIVMLSGLFSFVGTGLTSSEQAESIWQELSEPFDRSSSEEYVSMLDDYLLNN